MAHLGEMGDVEGVLESRWESGLELETWVGDATGSLDRSHR